MQHTVLLPCPAQPAGLATPSPGQPPPFLLPAFPEAACTLAARCSPVANQAQRARIQNLVGSRRSPVGRFRLPPAAGAQLSKLRYAIFSCSNWGFGYFNAYDAATRYDLDFWSHLGDYIYEYSVNTVREHGG